MVDPTTRTRKTALAFSLLAAAVSVYELIDWCYEVFFLHLSFLQAASMQPVAAGAFTLAGLSLALSLRAARGTADRAHWFRLTAQVCAGIILLVGLALVTGHCAGWVPDNGVPVVGEEPGNPYSELRFVTLNYAAHLLLLGVALLLVRRERRSIRLGVKCIVALIGLAAVIALVGDFFGTRFYTGAPAPGMISPCTALVMLALAGAVVLAQADRGFLKDLTENSAGSLLARRLLPAVLLGPTIIGWLARRAEQSLWWTPAAVEAGEVIGNILVLTSLVGWNVWSLINADRQRQAAEASAQESEGRFAGAFDHAPIGVALVAPGGKWLKVNPALCELVGYSEDEMLHGKYQDITHPDDRALGLDHIRRIMAGEMRSYQLEKRYLHRGGHVLTVVIKASLVRDELGAPAYFVTQIQDVTERKRAEEELRWKTAFLEAQINCSPDGILVVDANSRQIYRNPRFDELWRVPAKGYHSGDDEETLRHALSMTKNPDAFLEKVRYLYSHPDEMSQDELALKDDRYLDRYSAPVIGSEGTHYGRIWNFRDITERKSIEVSLRESEARYQRIASNVPGVVYRFFSDADANYSLPFVSEGCRDVIGVEPAAVMRDMEVLMRQVHPEDREELEATIAYSIANLSPWSWQGRFLHADTGATIIIQGAARLERGPNGATISDGVLVDVTARKQSEEDRRAKELAERTNLAKSQFLSRMSHELRTPLNAILGFGQVMEFSQLEEQDAQALSHILRGGRHLLSLVDEVLDLSRAEAGELRLTLADVDADAVVAECVGLVERLAEKRGVTCTVCNAERFGPLWCDEQRLRQMLLNLLSNAIKYNCEGGDVFIDAERVASNRLRLKVSDTGPGISPEGMARLFVPFERLDAEDGEVEGTGLGLVVSQRIAEAMDGTIGVESEVGQGSTFWIELPRPATPPPPPVVEVPTSTPEAVSTSASHESRLLYIEDNLSNLQVVKMMLSRQRPHWQFLSARNGTTGLEQAREHQPDVILLDLQMPGMPGEEVLKNLRQDPPTRDIPVIVLSADMTAPSRTRLLAAGADAYVTKPFEMGSFLELLDATSDKTR